MMYVAKRHLSRRALLKGASVSMALPFLDAMHPALSAERLTAAAIPLIWVAGIALFFGLGHFFWFLFLLPVLVTAVGRGLSGQELEHDRLHRDRGERREYRDRRHDHRRDWYR